MTPIDEQGVASFERGVCPRARAGSRVHRTCVWVASFRRQLRRNRLCPHLSSTPLEHSTDLPFRLEPLGPEHNERDRAAWTSSIDHIRSTPGLDAWAANWPVPMSLDDNLADLVRHRAESETREAFAYSVLRS